MEFGEDESFQPRALGHRLVEGSGVGSEEVSRLVMG